MSRMPARAVFAATLLGALLAGCAATVGHERASDASGLRSTQSAEATYPAIAEVFISAMTPEDNIDSPASWMAPDGTLWVIATAKATDRLVVYDGYSGATLRTVGQSGAALGQFDRPNGVAVIDDLLFIVERDNHRVQVMQLPGFVPVGQFGSEDLIKPYGLWVQATGEGYEVFVTDSYMAGEDAQGEDILPPLTALDRRVKRYAVSRQGDQVQGTLRGSFGDTGAKGALRVVESIWGDPAQDRLLIAEEDETYANELKVYDLDGRFTGRTFGREVFAAQSEGIALKRCAGGTGWWITTEQGKQQTVFHVFERGSLAHVGGVTGKLVANTDGIWLHEAPSKRFPQGVLYAVHDDQGIVALDWRDIAKALSLPACAAPQVDLQAGLSTQEANTSVPPGAAAHYAAGAFPDRIVASPAQDAARGFAVAWRTDADVRAPWLEWVVAGDSPAQGEPRRVVAGTHSLRSETGLAHHHRADIDGLQANTLYAYRVQGNGTWSPWQHFRTAALPGTPLTLLYFGDTQNKNASHSSRVLREAIRHAPDARLAVHTGDLVSGGDGEDDVEWGEWFDANGWLLSTLATAPAAGNHEYFEEFEDTPQERRVLGAHWPLTFALPRNGAPGAELTTYWFDYQDVRFVVLDGTSGLDLGTAEAQARWLEQVLGNAPTRWTVVMVHQPMYSPRQDRDNAALREHFLPVLERLRVDLVLQGHDHVYGRRGGELRGQGTPVYVVSVVGAKQYRLSPQARATMKPVAEDTQLFQVIRVDGDRLSYEARTATGQLYDAFELRDGGRAGKRLVENTEGRIAERQCAREATLKGRKDRCWE